MNDNTRGMWLAISAYLIWGVAAIYWDQTRPINARDLLAHRAVWSLPFVTLCLAVAGKGRLVGVLGLFRQPRTMAIMACAALAVACNWLLFLWAVTNGQAVEASLGYYLLPLLNVAMGLVLFRESLSRVQLLAIGFAVAGLLVQLVHYGGLPWVSLGLAISFGLYGAIRKAVAVESTEGLLLETVFMAPFALAWLWYRDGGGFGLYGTRVDLFLIASGAYTAIPLLAYVAASRLLPLTALGLVYYIGPTVQLVVAVWVFGEAFDMVQLAAFGLVWVGLLLVSIHGISRARKLRRYHRGTVADNGNSSPER